MAVKLILDLDVTRGIATCVLYYWELVVDLFQNGYKAASPIQYHLVRVVSVNSEQFYPKHR